MQSTQLLAVGVSLAHACLLAGVYFSSSVHTNAFVSTELHNLLFFRAALTAVVGTEAAICAAYIYQYQRASQPNTTAAFAFVAAAVAGWAVLATYQEDTTEHLVGAAVFIVATACYSLFFITKSQHARPFLYTLWALTVATAIAFAALYIAALYDPAADAEWAAFTLNAVTLCLFFSENPAEEAQAVKARQSAAELARPLLYLHHSAF